MEYPLPNLGQYGYVQPKNGLNWKLILGVFGTLIVGYFIYLLFFKKKEEKEGNDPKPESNMS